MAAPSRAPLVTTYKALNWGTKSIFKLQLPCLATKMQTSLIYSLAKLSRIEEYIYR